MKWSTGGLKARSLNISCPWLTPFTASQMMERRNNGDIVKGGGMSIRVGRQFEKELGIDLKKLVLLDVHAVADTDHSDMMSGVYERYVKTEEDRNAVLRGARDSMVVDRAYRAGLAYAMEQIS